MCRLTLGAGRALGLGAVGGAVLAVMIVPLAALSQALPATVSTTRDVPLPGDTSRFDYESLDPGTHRLYIAHLGAGTVPVYDTAAGAVVGEIQDVPGVHGVLVVADLTRLAVRTR